MEHTNVSEVKPWKAEYQWNPERFRYLLSRTHLSLKDFARASGVTKASAITYTKGAVPGYTAMCRIADYFCVPLDYLAGRLSDEEELLVKENFYSWYARKERRLFEKSYFEYAVTSSNIAPKVFEAAISPHEIRLFWPYNLIYDIQKTRNYDAPLKISGDDQLKGIEEALKSLEEREREILLDKYKEGMTLNDIGEKQHITRERVRQIVVSGIGKLTSPGTFEYIYYGYRGCGCIQKRKKLEKLERDLDRLISSDEKFIKGILDNDSLRELYDNHEKNRAKLKECGIAPHKDRDPKEVPLTAMKLSARPYNVLKKHGCRTAADVIAIANSGNLKSFSNIGRKSEEEIMEAIAVFA